MKIKYDPKVDAVYIALSKGEYHLTRKITEAILVDENSKGKILGIEILDAKKNITSFRPRETKFQTQTL